MDEDAQAEAPVVDTGQSIVEDNSGAACQDIFIRDISFLQLQLGFCVPNSFYSFTYPKVLNVCFLDLIVVFEIVVDEAFFRLVSSLFSLARVAREMIRLTLSSCRFEVTA